MNGSFSKYRTRGAYHWDHLSALPWKHHCFTALRYQFMVESASVKISENLLDVGCGDGALLSLFGGAAGVCAGVEPDPTGREIAQAIFRKKDLPIHVFSDLEEVPGESQDVVICAEVLEHVENVAYLLDGIKRVLKRDGRFILSTPVRISETPLDREHVHEFFPQELASLIASRFQITAHRMELPVFGVELYYWRPWFLLKLPLIKYLMNVLSAWFGYSVMRYSGSRYPTLQVIVACKA